MADADDEDSWLYGDKVKTESAEADLSQSAGDELLKKTDVADKEQKPEDQAVNNDSAQITNGTGGEKVNSNSEAAPSAPAGLLPAGNDKRSVNEDSDESEDDVQVTIGAISTGPGGNDGGGIFPLTGSGSRHLYRNPVQVIGTPKATVGKGLDLAAPGNINGQAVIDFNLESLEDKPWRKPGADISDYFNYGFNEVTWKVYCEKQKRLRSGMDAPLIPQTTSVPVDRNSSVLSTILSKFDNKQRLPSTPVANRFENSVRSISTLQFTRRKEDGLAPGTPDTNLAVTSSVASTPSASPLTQTTSPMYTIPPVNGPAIPIHFDPTKPPPSLPIGLPPHGFPGGTTMLPPGLRPPGTEFVQLPPVSGAPFPPPPGSYLIPPVSQPQQQQQTFYVSEEGEEPRSQPEGARSDDESRLSREPRSSSSRRDYDRDRERERDRYSRRSDYRDGRDDYRERSRERDRDRDRGRDKDRERDRERDRDGRRRREESPPRHKSTRRKHEDDDRYNSGGSKHKKAKKHKHKGKDGSGGDEEPMLTEDQIKKEPM